jgi:hypothetical protein
MEMVVIVVIQDGGTCISFTIAALYNMAVSKVPNEQGRGIQNACMETFGVSPTFFVREYCTTSTALLVLHY